MSRFLWLSSNLASRAFDNVYNYPIQLCVDDYPTTPVVTLLAEIALRSNFDYVNMLLENGAAINYPSVYEEDLVYNKDFSNIRITLLIAAVERGNIEIIRVLLTAGAEID